MQRRTFLRLSALAPLAWSTSRAHPAGTPATAAIDQVPDGQPHRFTLSRQGFELDGRPLQIRCGQMDPIRIPRPYWRHRIRMARAMGLNAIAIYVMWNALEAEPGRFDFSNRRDFPHFIDLCREEGMWVYLRPGPYVCAEWDFGGLPAWLLRDPDTRVRDGNDKAYMQAVANYFDAIAPRIATRMADQGGPILMLQLENEYASFGRDRAYLEILRRMWRERHVDGPFSISDGLAQLQKAGTFVPGTALGLDGDTDFAAAQAIAGDSPVWVGEGYTGWLTHWGDQGFQHDDYADTLRKLMAAGRSFNLYEVHGGTNFGFGAGANAKGDGSGFQPVITSYDYAAPIDERGVATPACHQLRAIIAEALQKPLPDLPAPPPAAAFAEVVAQPWTSLWDHLPPPHRVDRPAANEVLFGQNQGMVLYRTRVRVDTPTPLRIEGVHDYATVFADGRYMGCISRVQGAGLPTSDTLTLPASTHGEMQIDILVDSFGHVGYGHYIRDGKGLVGDAWLGTRALRGWQAYSLPLDAAHLHRLEASTPPGSRPGMFFKARITLAEPADCYVDMGAWDKGYVWVNGHLLGRHWRIGPQQRLYCPAEWWRHGENVILIFDQHRTEPTPIHGAPTLHDD